MEPFYSDSSWCLADRKWFAYIGCVRCNRWWGDSPVRTKSGWTILCSGLDIIFKYSISDDEY